MRDSVRAVFPGFSARFESFEVNVYLDSIRKLTTGVGHLLGNGDVASATADAQRMPWEMKDGAGPASPSQIAAEVQRIYDAWPTQSVSDRAIASLVLSRDAVTALLWEDAAKAEALLVRDVPAFESLYADAQLAMLSDAWAMGGGFVKADHFTSLAASLAQSPPDYLAAKAEAHYRGNGSAPRIAANDLCWANAAAAQAAGDDPAKLWWPNAHPDVAPPSAGTSSGGLVALVAIGLALGVAVALSRA